MELAQKDAELYNIKTKVIGIGGGGNNAVNRMIRSGMKGVEFIAINTDKQALEKSVAPIKLGIGEKITNGFGAGSNVEIGKRAAEEAVNEIKRILAGTDLLFITASMGGGTGTGAAPIVARVAQEMEILTVGVVTTPFAFEGRRRMEQAREGIKELGQYVDSLVVIPNERLKMVSDARITLANAFSQADDVLLRGVQSISDLINGVGFVNIDFADVTSILTDAGIAYMGVGSATGKDKAQAAASMAISSPLLETSIKGAKGVIISIAASVNVGLEDIDLASNMVVSECNPEASVIWGVTFDESMDDGMRITIIAAGFDPEPAAEEKPAVQAVPEKEAAPAESEKKTDALDDFFSSMK